MNRKAEHTFPPRETVFEVLDRIENSASFARSDQLRRLLNHIVRQTLDGNHDQLLGKNIASDVFGVSVDETTDLSGVRVEIGRLRSRLGHYYQTEGADDPIEIEIPKGSYVAKIRSVPRGAGTGASGSLPLRIKDAFRDVGRFFSRPVGLVIGAGVAGAIAFGLTLVYPASDGQAASALPLVAVSNIENLSDEPDYLAVGLTADLINRLVRFDHIVMVSRATMAQADADGGEAVSFGRRLEADYQLVGALQDAPDGQRLTLELLTVPDGEVRWVGEYGLPDSGPDILSARMDAVNAIALTIASRDGVVPRLETSETDRAANRTSYLCVLRYYAYLQQRAPAEFASVRACLEAAAEETPSYAEVWSSLAQIYLDERRNGFAAGEGSGDPIDRAYDAAARAVRLEPDSASAHSVLAAVEYFRQNIPAFNEAAKKALDLNPNDPDAHAYLGHLLSMSGSWELGQQLVAEAIEMSPVHPPLWHHSTAMGAMLEQDYERALQEAELGEMPRFYMSYVLLAAMHGHLGNSDGAARAVAELEALRPDYLANVQTDMSRRNFQPELIESFEAGLTRAYAMAEAE